MRPRLLLLLLLLSGCTPRSTPPPPAPAPPPVVFTDVTEAAGIRFQHVNGATGKKYLPETMGSGCAFLDYDNDGRQDILLVNSTGWTQEKSTGATLHLYHNDDGQHFSDVTEQVGLKVSFYGMGVTVGDYDNDGWDDLYITGVGGCKLFHNEPGKREEGRGKREHLNTLTPQHPNAQRPTPNAQRLFRDVTDQAGVRSPGWGTSATWVDYDRDGKLDLFVCHYVQWSPKTDLFYSTDNIHKSYATPQQYPGETCRLYHNEGGGRFTDVTRHAGIFNTHSKALGVAVCDMDQDGFPDLIVANDTEPNFLFHNEGNGTFKEIALETGIARAETGRAKAGMGLDTGDDLNNGRESIVITNFAGEQLTLYRRDEAGQYMDVAARSGIGNASQFYLGFGVLFLDYDGDGWQDIFVANGHIQDDATVRQTGVEYAEQALLFRNTGGGNFVDITTAAGRALVSRTVGRGAAWGDFDNDGAPDLLLTANNGPARLLHNDNKTGNHWLRLVLVGTHSNRNAIGARVRLHIGAQTLMQTVKGASSYLSQSDRRLLFGLGGAKQVDSIDIQWPSGQVQTLGGTPADQTLTIREEAAH